MLHILLKLCETFLDGQQPLQPISLWVLPGTSTADCTAVLQQCCSIIKVWLKRTAACTSSAYCKCLNAGNKCQYSTAESEQTATCFQQDTSVSTAMSTEQCSSGAAVNPFFLSFSPIFYSSLRHCFTSPKNKKKSKGSHLLMKNCLLVD